MRELPLIAMYEETRQVMMKDVANLRVQVQTLTGKLLHKQGAAMQPHEDNSEQMNKLHLQLSHAQGVNAQLEQTIANMKKQQQDMMQNATSSKQQQQNSMVLQIASHEWNGKKPTATPPKKTKHVAAPVSPMQDKMILDLKQLLQVKQGMKSTYIHLVTWISLEHQLVAKVQQLITKVETTEQVLQHLCLQCSKASSSNHATVSPAMIAVHIEKWLLEIQQCREFECNMYV